MSVFMLFWINVACSLFALKYLAILPVPLLPRFILTTSSTEEDPCWDGQFAHLFFLHGGTGHHVNAQRARTSHARSVGKENLYEKQSLFFHD